MTPQKRFWRYCCADNSTRKARKFFIPVSLESPPPYLSFEPAYTPRRFVLAARHRDLWVPHVVSSSPHPRLRDISPPSPRIGLYAPSIERSGLYLSNKATQSIFHRCVRAARHDLCAPPPTSYHFPISHLLQPISPQPLGRSA